MEKWTDIPEGGFEPSQDVENIDVLEAKKRPPNPSRYVWQKVNEITWKLTDGEMTNVPRSHGQWGGYRTSKAVAWVIDISATEKSAWIARYKDQCSNPMPLKQAKAAAMAMAKGVPGDYRVTRPIAHLNGIAARLLDSMKRPGTLGFRMSRIGTREHRALRPGRSLPFRPAI